MSGEPSSLLKSKYFALRVRSEVTVYVDGVMVCVDPDPDNPGATGPGSLFEREGKFCAQWLQRAKPELEKLFEQIVKEKKFRLFEPNVKLLFLSGDELNPLNIKKQKKKFQVLLQPDTSNKYDVYLYLVVDNSYQPNEAQKIVSKIQTILDKFKPKKD